MGIQAFITIGSVLIGCVYLVSRLRQLPGYLRLALLSINLLLIFEFIQTPDKLMALSDIFKLQVWIVFPLVLSMSLNTVDRIKYMQWAGISAFIFFFFSVVIDTALSGGYVCWQHYIWEFGGRIFREDRFAYIFALAPWVAFSLTDDNERKIHIVLLVLSFGLGLMICFSGVRNTWVGLLVFSVSLLFISFRSKLPWSIRLFSPLVLLGFVVGFSLNPSRVLKRFYYEAPTLIAVKNNIKASFSNTHGSQPPQTPVSIPKKIKLTETLSISPVDPTLDMTRLGSGRIQIWGSVIEVWERVSLKQKLFGSGFRAPQRLVGKESHTDSLLMLMNFGLVGCFIVLLFLMASFYFLFSGSHVGERPEFIAILVGVLFTILLVGFFSGILLFTPRAWYLATFVGFFSAVNRAKGDMSEIAGREIR